MDRQQLDVLNKEVESLSPEAALKRVLQLVPGEAVFSTSFSLEDQAITHLLATQALPVNIFTLDTGRLFPETYSVWSRTLAFYGISIEAFYPGTASVEQFVKANGPNAFYNTVELRKTCCHIRKVEPLKRALQGKALWITGLRKEHSPDRNLLQALEWDETHGLVKFHPLLHMDGPTLKIFVLQNGIPYNPLHDKGFVSIGCAPCTRAIREGEDFRAGRWWWEDTTKKECGLHSR